MMKKSSVSLHNEIPKDTRNRRNTHQHINLYKINLWPLYYMKTFPLFKKSRMRQNLQSTLLFNIFIISILYEKEINSMRKEKIVKLSPFANNKSIISRSERFNQETI